MNLHGLLVAAVWAPAVAFAKISDRYSDDLVRLPVSDHGIPWWASTCIAILGLIALLECLRIWWGR